jgi:hypothetical protein
MMIDHPAIALFLQTLFRSHCCLIFGLLGTPKVEVQRAWRKHNVLGFVDVRSTDFTGDSAKTLLGLSAMP